MDIYSCYTIKLKLMLKEQKDIEKAARRRKRRETRGKYALVGDEKII